MLKVRSALFAPYNVLKELHAEPEVDEELGGSEALAPAENSQGVKFHTMGRQGLGLGFPIVGYYENIQRIGLKWRIRCLGGFLVLFS